MDNRFCFLAIVRDEAPNIERCLTSIKNIATSYLICDTGSVDNTPAIVSSFMERHNIPGEVIFREWVSYGETKSELLKAFRGHPIVGSAKYIFWLDADEVFITKKDDPTSYLTIKDAAELYTYLEGDKSNIFRVPTIYGNLEYPRWQIARNNQLYVWKLPYQEYFEGTSSNTTTNLPLSIWNLARHEGNSSRDPEITKKRIKMAESWIERNPTDTDMARVIFYLAEAYISVDRSKAIELYKQRLNMLNGYYQERYICLLKLGQLVKELEMKLYYWNVAQEMIPNRLEAYYDMFMHYYNSKNHRKAIGVYKMAPPPSTIGGRRVPPSDALFIQRNIYDYLFDLNASVSYYSCQKYKKAYLLGEILLTQKLYPPSMATLVETNMKYFREKYTPVAIKEASAGITSISNFQIKDSLPLYLVIDSFYENPLTIRDTALKMPFDVKGNYPGGRTKSAPTEETKRRFESIIGRKITYWPDQYNGSFQYTTKENRSWIHRDNTDFSAVVYLTPGAPLNGGTVLYRHKRTGLERTFTKEQEEELNNDGNDESKWEVTDRIGNKFNRAIIFQGKYSHKSDLYFGDDLQSGRLFQTFFFNI